MHNPRRLTTWRVVAANCRSISWEAKFGFTRELSSIFCATALLCLRRAARVHNWMAITIAEKQMMYPPSNVSTALLGNNFTCLRTTKKVDVTHTAKEAVMAYCIFMAALYHHGLMTAKYLSTLMTRRVPTIAKRHKKKETTMTGESQSLRLKHASPAISSAILNLMYNGVTTPPHRTSVNVKLQRYRNPGRNRSPPLRIVTRTNPFYRKHHRPNMVVAR